MPKIDIDAIEKQAQQEMSEEIVATAVEKLKDLYTKREKALLIVHNIDKEIVAYKIDIAENAVYESAGINTTGK